MERKFSKHYSSVDRVRYEVEAGLTKNEIEEIASNPDLKVIQFLKPLKKIDFELLEKYIFAKKIKVELRSYSYTPKPLSLDFLKYLPSLKKLTLDNAINVTHIDNIISLKNIEEFSLYNCEIELFSVLEHINPKLKKLSIGKTLTKKINLNFISRFSNLEYIYIDGHSNGIEEINKLKNLKEIVLRSISLPNIDFLNSMPKLVSVDIKLGGIKDFSVLEHLNNIKYLELWQIRGLKDISFISKMKGLQNIHLESLAHIEALPYLDDLNNLRRIKLMNLNGLKNLNAIKTVPYLEDFFFTIIKLNVDELIPVLENPNIKNVYAYFSSEKKNNMFTSLAKKYGKNLDFPEFNYEN